MDAASLLRASAWLFAAAAGVGSVLVGLRFGFGRPAPKALRRVHGMLAAAGLGALGWAWASVGVPRAGAVALALLAVAAAGGIVTTRARRWRLPVPTEVLAFGHLSIAAMGCVMLLVAVVGGR